MKVPTNACNQNTGQVYPLFKTPYAPTTVQGLDPASPVYSLYSRMNTDQQKVIDNRLVLLNAGIPILAICFILWIICAIYAARHDIKIDASNPTAFTMFGGIMAWGAIAGAILTGVGASYDNAAGDQIFQIVCNMPPATTAPATLPPHMLKRH